MGASFQIAFLTLDDEGRRVYEPYQPQVDEPAAALPVDGGSWAYTHVAQVLTCFGVKFDAEFSCGALNPRELLSVRNPEITACVNFPPVIVDRVNLLRALAFEAERLAKEYSTATLKTEFVITYG